MNTNYDTGIDAEPVFSSLISIRNVDHASMYPCIVSMNFGIRWIFYCNLKAFITVNEGRNLP